MADIQMLTSIELQSPEARTAVEKLVQEIVRFGEVREAFEAARILAERMKGNRELEKTFAVHLAQLKAAALPLLTDEGALTIFGDFIPVILAHPEIDVLQGLRSKTIGMPEEERRRPVFS